MTIHPVSCDRGSLTDADRDLIAKARTLADLRGADIRRRTGESDLAMALASAVGEMQHTLRELAAVAERAGR
jgi:hypothetical protein